jgi:hypothetical protein
MPPGTVYVGRPSLWGNPFDARKHGSVAAVEYFRSFLTGQFDLVPRQAHREFRAGERRFYGNGAAPLYPGELAAILLRGKNLVCWCPLDMPCHADVLLELAA